MAVKPLHPNPPQSYISTVEQIMEIYRSLSPRPSLEQVEAAKIVVKTVTTEQESKLDEISKVPKPQDVPLELFEVSQEIKINMVKLQSYEQRREAAYLVDLDKFYENIDELIQKASGLVFGDDGNEQVENLSSRDLSKKKVDGGVVKLASSRSLVHSSSTRDSSLFLGDDDMEKLNLMKVASVIESYAKSGESVLDLQGKLVDQMEWIPVSLGKLTAVTVLNVSDNHLMALPSAIGNLKALTKFDAHSNQLINLPDSFGELVNLVDVDLHNNRLKTLPFTFGNLKNLMNLDLSSNYFSVLPDTLGSLTCLKTLNLETNELEELPFTIGSCSALEELRLDFNQLKALPEATGKLESLRVLKMHYNRIKGLPTTIGNLSKLRELDISFNELEFVPESLGFATSLVKLNLSNNFADLTALPRSIGNLEMLEELDISNSQIRHLPDSFALLSNLRVFHANETPLEEPPRQVIKLGAQEVVLYMANLIAMKDVENRPAPVKKTIWYWFCSLLRPRKTTST
ncbi:hypothetical protein ACHQM5_007617 [Ranunculus cassubicifolius]